MWVDFAIFVVIIALLMHFSEEFTVFLKKCMNFSGIKFLAPLLLFFLSEYFAKDSQRWLVGCQNVVRYMASQLQLSWTMQGFSRLLMVLLLSTLPTMFVLRKAQLSKYPSSAPRFLLIYHVVFWGLFILLSFPLN